MSTSYAVRTISSLPPEILCMIFLAGHSADTQPASPPFELTVSHTSSIWRKTALALPHLWTRLVVSTFLTRTTMYLSRSAAAPLDIHFLIRMDFIEAEMHMIMTHAARWRTVSITANTTATLAFGRLLTYLAPLAVPLLKHISIRVTAPASSSLPEITLFQLPALPYLSILTAGAPLLSTIHIEGAGIHMCTPPLASTHTIALHAGTFYPPISHTHFLSTITPCSSSLRTLTLSGPLVNIWSLDPANMLFLPALRVLCLSSSGGVTNNIEVLLVLSAPVLSSLTLDGFRDTDIAFLFLRVSMRDQDLSPEVRELILTGCSFLDERTFQRLAELFPTVTRLHLTGESSWGRGLLEDKTQMWPSLDTITAEEDGEADRR